MKNQQVVTNLIIGIAVSIPSLFNSCQRRPGYKFITGYEGMASYIEAARSHPTADVDSLYRHFMMPYWKECCEGGEYAKYFKDRFFKPIHDLDSLDYAIQMLRDSKIEQVFEQTLLRITRLLPGPEVTVCIFALDPRRTFVREFMHSVTGFCPGSGRIVLYAYSEKDWLQWFPLMLAHEYHHNVWTHHQAHQDKSFLDTFGLLDNILLEGRADSFAKIVFPDMKSAHTTALSKEQEAEQWKSMQSFLDDTSDVIHSKYMIGGDGIPLWTGYTIGFNIVQSYIQNHPNASIDDWTYMDAYELLASSKYNEKFTLK